MPTVLPPTPTSPNVTPTIRAVREVDIPLVLELLVAMDAEDGSSRSLEISADHLREVVFGPNQKSDALVADHAGQLVGIAAYRDSASTLWSRPEIYLDDLFVRPEFRRCGIGEGLLHKLAGLVIERSATRIILNVQADNLPAVSFYKSIGATIFPDSRACAIAGDPLAQLASAARLE